MKRNGLLIASVAAIAAAVIAQPAAGAPASGSAASPSSQPGNGRILFHVTGLTDHLFLMGPDGSNVTPADPPGSFSSREGRFSPDGKRILFTTVGTDGLDIAVMNADGSGEVNLTPGADVSETSPAWFPDGSRILYAQDSIPGAGVNFDVIAANADGANPVNLTSARTTTNEFPYDVSPDGGRILFRTDDGGDPDVFTMNADGSNLVNLTADSSGYDQAAAFTRDGRSVALARDVDASAEYNFDIFLIDSRDGSGDVDITELPEQQFDPAPSPDGKQIAFHSSGVINVARIDGSGRSPLPAGAGGEEPSWEPLYRCGGRLATVLGTTAPEILKGTKGDDVIIGRAGNDKIVGRGGRDRICGGEGKDKLKGQAGNDRLFGEGGRDKLTGGAGSDTVKGGAGRDVEKR
jgi:Ca2+-binding RTX toxin-like protein